MNRMEHVKALRASTEPHYNCCQSVLIPFAGEMGLTEEQACALGSHFGSGMKHGSTCGALTGALMVLGMAGYGEEQSAALLRRFREDRGALTCAELLKASHERGEARKDHCDGLVFYVTELLDQIFAQP